MPGFSEPLFHAKPDNGAFFTTIELQAIWDIEVPFETVMAAREPMRQYHLGAQTYWPKFTAGGINDELAVSMIDRATLADHDARTMLSFSILAEPEPPQWPCLLDHSHEAEFEADGWIHGDPDTYAA